MTLLLAVLGAVLCSWTASSEVVPQADFDPQAVRHVHYHHFLNQRQYAFFPHSSSQQLQPGHLSKERISHIRA